MIVACVFGDAVATISRIVFIARSSCAGDSVRRSPATTVCAAMTLVFPDAEPRVCAASKSTAVPPRITPGLNVRCSSPAIFSRKALRMRAASKMAPWPNSSRKICDECAGVPVTRSCQSIVPRRAVTA